MKEPAPNYDSFTGALSQFAFVVLLVLFGWGLLWLPSLINLERLVPPIVRSGAFNDFVESKTNICYNPRPSDVGYCHRIDANNGHGFTWAGR